MSKKRKRGNEEEEKRTIKKADLLLTQENKSSTKENTAELHKLLNNGLYNGAVRGKVLKLIKNTTNIDLNSVDENNETAIIKAIKQATPIVFKELHKNGADIITANNEGKAPIDTALDLCKTENGKKQVHIRNILFYIVSEYNTLIDYISEFLIHKINNFDRKKTQLANFENEILKILKEIKSNEIIIDFLFQKDGDNIFEFARQKNLDKVYKALWEYYKENEELNDKIKQQNSDNSSNEVSEEESSEEGLSVKELYKELFEEELSEKKLHKNNDEMNLDRLTTEEIKQYKECNQKENLSDRSVTTNIDNFKFEELLDLNGESTATNIDFNAM